MADKFDPYREALVMETDTVWPAEFDSVAPAKRQQVEAALHKDPAPCDSIVYVRTHTGFCRQITVTSADLNRVG